jgi:hypothetical protein
MLLAKNYALYYGYGKVKELSHFDISIIDSKGLTVEEIHQLKVRNTIVITYLSIFEVSPTDAIFKELSYEDFWLIDGEPIKNEVYGTYLVSMHSEKWINYLLNEIQRQIVAQESDGLFLDTIGDVELLNLPKDLMRQQLDGVVKLLFALKMLYPYHLFIQNNGLEKVCQLTAPYIDGICWENPPIGLASSEGWVDVITDKLVTLKDKYNLKVFLLLEESVEVERQAYEKARKFAKKNEFLLYNAPSKYVDGVNLIK